MIGVIQAGGRSARMGEDKSWLILDGRPMIGRALAAARPVANRLAIVINAANPQAARYRQFAAEREAEIVHDLHEHRGPLGGIHTALTLCAAGEPALVLACDLPFITAELLGLLRRIHEGGQDALTIPLDATGRPQPLAAVYASACLGPVAEMLAAGDLKVEILCSRVPTRRIAFAEVAHLSGAGRFFLNVNTPEDYRAALKV